MEKVTIGPINSGFSFNQNGVQEKYKVAGDGITHETVDTTGKVLSHDKIEIRPSNKAGVVIVNDGKGLKVGEIKKITPNISAGIAEKLKVVTEKAARAFRR